MVLNVPLDECIDNTHIKQHKRKEKDKKQIKGNLSKRWKAKERQRARSLEEEQVSDPLGNGKGSTHPRPNHAQAKSANHRTKARTPQRAPPAHMQAPPEPKYTPPKLMC
jgi:hypothetical protein